MKKLMYFVGILLLAVVLVACNKPKSPVVEEDKTPPIMMGVNDVTIFEGDQFDPMAGVSASDNVDGDLTSKIVITGEVDVNVVAVYDLNYSVTDKAGNKTEKPRKVNVVEKQASDLYLVNGDFTQPFEGAWGHWSGDGGESTATVEDGMLKYDVTANGANWYSSQVFQAGLTVTKGKIYVLTFDAKATTPRNIRIKIETNGAPYTTYMDAIFKIETTMEEFSHEFKITLPSLTDGKFIIGIGNMQEFTGDEPISTVYFDNFKFTEKEAGPDVTAPLLGGVEDKLVNINEPFDPLEGVTVTDDVDDLTTKDIAVTGIVNVAVVGEYEITYEVTDKAGNKTKHVRKITVTDQLIPSNLVIINGDFATEQLTPLPQPAATGWGWHGGGVFNAQIKDGIVSIDVLNLGPLPWGVQFYQQNRIVDKGFIYEIKFRAKADFARPIMFALESGTNRQYDEIINITDVWEEYTIVYKHEKDSFTNGKFAFFMGLVDGDSVPTKIYLDDITVTTIAAFRDDTAPMLFGISDQVVGVGANFDALLGVKLYDNHNRDLTLDNLVVTGEVNTEVAGNYDVTYVITDLSGNSKTYTRKVQVVEIANLNENKFGLKNGDFSISTPTPTAQPAESNWGWHGRDGGAFTVDIPGGVDGKATIDVTAIGTLPHSIQFYQQNRHVETGGIYKFEFTMNATVATTIRLSLESGTNVKWFQLVDVEAAEKTYTYYMTNPGLGFTDGKLGFFLGNSSANSKPSQFIIDNVSVELVGYRFDNDDPMILGVTPLEVARGMEVDATTGLHVFDLSDMYVKKDLIQVTPPADFDNTIPGNYDFSLLLKDRAGNEVTVTRTITIIDGILPSRLNIINADFEIEQLTPVPQRAETGWGWHGGGKFTAQVKDGVAKIQVFNTGIDWFGVQFYQQNKILDQNSVYEIKFRAKADVARTLRFSLENQTPGPAFSYHQQMLLTTDWVEYKVIYVHQNETYVNVKLGFFLGQLDGLSVPTTVYLDDLTITTIETAYDDIKPIVYGAHDIKVLQNSHFNVLDGLSVGDNLDTNLTVNDIVVTGTVDTAVVGLYTLTYKLTDTAGNIGTYSRVVEVVEPAAFEGINVGLNNADFETEQSIPDATAWGWHGAGEFTAEIKNGIATINVTNVGTVAHGVQFYQLNKSVEATGIYKFSFKMKASVARNIRLSLEAGTNLRDFKVIGITTEWATYEVTMAPNGGSFNNAKIAFFLGKVDNESVPAVFEIDDVSFVKVGYREDTEKPTIFGANDVEIKQNATFDPLTGISVYDYVDASLKNENIVITGTVDTAVIGIYTLTYTLTDSQGNIATYERKVSVVE